MIEASGDQNMHQLSIDVLNSRGVAALLTGETGLNSLSRGRKTPGRAGQFPFDRMLKFYNFNSINQAVADSKRGDTIKPVLRMGSFAYENDEL